MEDEKETAIVTQTSEILSNDLLKMIQNPGPPFLYGGVLSPCEMLKFTIIISSVSKIS